MSKILPLQYAKILYALTVDLSEKELQKNIEAFIALLQKNQSLNKLPYIIKEFEIYSDKVQGNEKAVIKTARELPKSSIEEIKKFLSLKGEVKVKMDENILGGVVVQVGNKIFDASLKTQINKLKQQLI